MDGILESQPFRAEDSIKIVKIIIDHIVRKLHTGRMGYICLSKYRFNVGKFAVAMYKGDNTISFYTNFEGNLIILRLIFNDGISDIKIKFTYGDNEYIFPIDEDMKSAATYLCYSFIDWSLNRRRNFVTS